jgi:hypothetical protein
MKFNTEIIITSPLTGEKSKWQGPRIEADDFQQAEKAAFASVIYVTGENVPREQLSVNMQPPRSLAFVKKMDNDDWIELGIIDAFFEIFENEQSVLATNAEKWLYNIDDERMKKIVSALGVQVFNPLNPETIRMKNENLFHPDFVSKLNEAEAIGGVVISYLPEV